MRKIILLSSLIVLTTFAAGCKNSQTDTNEETLPSLQEQQSQAAIQEQSATSESTINDECGSIVSSIVSKDEKANYACEENSNCEWRGLGGKIESHWACCPKDLSHVNLEETPSLSRCLMRID